MDTFNLWEDILGFFSYSIFLIFFLCVSVCVVERKGGLDFLNFFTALQIYIRALMLGCTAYTVAPPHFFIGPFYPFYYFPFF